MNYERLTSDLNTYIRLVLGLLNLYGPVGTKIGLAHGYQYSNILIINLDNISFSFIFNSNV